MLDQIIMVDQIKYVFVVLFKSRNHANIMHNEDGAAQRMCINSDVIIKWPTLRFSIVTDKGY